MGNGQSANGKDQTIVLTTRVDGDNKEAGEDRYNENTVKSADVFFFNADQTGECIYAQTGLQADEENKLNVTLDYDIIHEGSSYYIYVCAYVSDVPCRLPAACRIGNVPCLHIRCMAPPVSMVVKCGCIRSRRPVCD